MRSTIIVSCLLASLTACAPTVVGTWNGTTSGCANADDDGTDVTISVSSTNDTDRAALVTTLGLAGLAGAAACLQDGGDVADATALAFSTTSTCDTDTVDYDVALVADADTADSQSGTIDVSINGGAASRCELTVTR